MPPEKLRKVGLVSFFKTSEGHKVLVLPTCSVPLHQLIPENWGTQKNRDYFDVGKTRHVIGVGRLRDGVEIPRLFVKSPERRFERSHQFSRNVNSLMSSVIDVTGKVVEDQVKWEARVLLGLAQGGIDAEIPQAIIIRKDGSKQLVTERVASDPQEWLLTNQNGSFYADVRNRAAELGLEPQDLTKENTIKKPNGPRTVIDVARWRVRKLPRVKRTLKMEQLRSACKHYSDEKHIAKLTRAIVSAMKR